VGRKNLPSRNVRKRLAAERREREEELKELACALWWEWAAANSLNGQPEPTPTYNGYEQ